MTADRLVLALLAGAVALIALALAGVGALVTSGLGVLALLAALAAERRAATEHGRAIGELPRPASTRYLLIALPFLFVVGATGEEHVLACVGAAVLSQAAYVRAWRAGAADPR